jgi:hypothetical protein
MLRIGKFIEIHWATAWQMYQAADELIHGFKSDSAMVVAEGVR